MPRNLKKTISSRVIAAAILLVLACLLPVIARSQTMDNISDQVYGQKSFETYGENLVDRIGFADPTSVAVDTSVVPNRLYVVEFTNDRILGYASTSGLASGAPADLVIGQPNFDEHFCNNGGVSAATLCEPEDIVVDSAGNLWVTDGGNSRVLRFDSPFTTDTVADLVLGQGGSMTSSLINYPAGDPAADNFDGPIGLAIDSSGRLYVADSGNHRVLVFGDPAANPTAGYVLGQPDFLTNARLATNVSTLDTPKDAAINAAGEVFICDSGNNRVVAYPSVSSPFASRVYGQPSFLLKDAPSPPSGATLSNPRRIAIDVRSNLWVADTDNNRVLIYNAPLAQPAGDAADRVLGQPTMMTNQSNQGLPAPTASTFDSPRGIALIGSGANVTDAWIVDMYNGRALHITSPLSSSVANIVLGQAAMDTGGFNLVDRIGFNNPHEIAIDESRNPPRIWVSDETNNRVLGWSNAFDFAMGKQADRVVGQPNFSSHLVNNGGTSASSLSSPRGIAVDRSTGDLWVADKNNHRVLYYASPYDTNNNIADRVIGQGGMNVNQPNRGTPTAPNDLSLYGPCDVALDPNGNLYVADRDNHRVLRFNTPIALLNFQADAVYGQADFFSQTPNLSNAARNYTMNSPSGVAVDPNRDSVYNDYNLYVADSANNRVLRFDSPSTMFAAVAVYGQADFSRTGRGLGPSGFDSPLDVHLDANGNMFVADQDNNRVLEFDAPKDPMLGTQADRVFGQPTFDTWDADFGMWDVNAKGLDQPRGVMTDSAGNLYVADRWNNRVLVFVTGPDTDGDRLSDAEELNRLGTNPNDADTDDDGVWDGDERLYSEDTDADGLINARDPDSDGDGLFDGTETGLTAVDPTATNVAAGHFVADADPSTTTEPTNADTDLGGTPDGVEDTNLNGQHDAAIDLGDPLDWGDDDPDNDCLYNRDEVGVGTDPRLADTDGDFLNDGFEVGYCGDTDPFTLTNPVKADTDDDCAIDGIEDADRDGAVDSWETDPVNPDTDGDALPDGIEMGLSSPTCNGDADAGATKTNPLDADSDDDGLPDGSEDANLNGVVDSNETDPNIADTDGDGLTDGAEVNLYNTDPTRTDTDNDGLTDGDEINVYHTNPNLWSTDGGCEGDGYEISVGHDPLNSSDDVDCMQNGTLLRSVVLNCQSTPWNPAKTDVLPLTKTNPAMVYLGNVISPTDDPDPDVVIDMGMPLVFYNIVDTVDPATNSFRIVRTNDTVTFTFDM